MRRLVHAALLLTAAPLLAQAQGEQTAPAARPGAPVETAPPNVPELKPAFVGQTRAPAVRTATPLAVTTLASGLNKPWAVAALPDGRFLVSEKAAGRLTLVDAKGNKTPLAGTPRTDARGQGGMLDVVLAPDFASSRRIYWSYAQPREGGNGLAVAHGRLGADRVEQVRIIYRAMPTLDSTMHYGGRLVFAPGGHLFVTSGERSILPGRKQARDPQSSFGKVVRLTRDGAPAGGGMAGARPENWTQGHRNALSAALDGKGRLWVVEMGPRGGDELNLIERGKDYGWPTIGYGEEYSGTPIHRTTQQAGLEQPVYYWDPVISPSGMVIYSGGMFPEWRGNVLTGGLSATALVRLVLNGDRVVGEERLLADRGQRIRDVRQAADGSLLLLTDDANGQLLRVARR